jgi:hypothetical protein
MPAQSSAEDSQMLMASRQSRSANRSTIFAIGSIIFAIACVVLALEFFAVERLPPLTEAQLEAAQKVWKERGLQNYSVDIELHGAQPGVIHVEVKNGEVTATTRDNRVPPKWAWDTWSVPAMFDTLEQDLQIAQDPSQQIQAAPGTTWKLRCEFDPEFAYPRRYHRFVTGGPEVYWQVTKFEPRY